MAANGKQASLVTLSNPILEEATRMRPTLAAGADASRCDTT